VCPGEQCLEAVEINCDCFAVEEITLVRSEDALSEVSARVADRVPEPLPYLGIRDIRPEGGDELVGRRPFAVEGEVREELLRMRAEPAPARLRRRHLERAEHG